tara:strand:- start:157 stop:372 length:216 start_codon:yes stop_codon:yes gene_type:complete
MMKEREKMVKIGTKVVINYGAGIPEDYGVITDHKNDGVSDYAVITGDGFTMTAHTINEKSVNGSPIGVWTI